MEPAEETTPLCVPRNVVRAAPTPSLSRAREVLIIATLGCAGLLNVGSLFFILSASPLTCYHRQIMMEEVAFVSGEYLLTSGMISKRFSPYSR